MVIYEAPNDKTGELDIDVEHGRKIHDQYLCTG